MLTKESEEESVLHVRNLGYGWYYVKVYKTKAASDMSSTSDPREKKATH